MTKPKSHLIILSGPSGVGKDAVFSRMKQLGRPFYYVTTITTRPPRPKEKNGIDYYFLTIEEFKQKIAQNELLEWAEVYGNYYGIPRKEIELPLKEGKDVIVKVDVQGTATLKKLFPEAIAIFLLPPSEEELIKRLRQRHSESQADLDYRLKTVQQEMKSLPLFNYVVVNHTDKLDETVTQIENIIAAQKLKGRK